MPWASGKHSQGSEKWLVLHFVASPQPSSEPATNHHGFLLLEQAPGADILLGSWTQTGTRGPFGPAPLGNGQSEGAATRPLPGPALLCCVFCGKSRFGFIMFLFLPCSPFLYAARNPPCLLAAAQEASGMFIRFFFSLLLSCGCWGLLLR